VGSILLAPSAGVLLTRYGGPLSSALANGILIINITRKRRLAANKQNSFFFILYLQLRYVKFDPSANNKLLSYFSIDKMLIQCAYPNIIILNCFFPAARIVYTVFHDWYIGNPQGPGPACWNVRTEKMRPPLSGDNALVSLDRFGSGIPRMGVQISARYPLLTLRRIVISFYFRHEDG
jgi:hypothetical protein